MATCSCGRDTFKGGWAEPGLYCPRCGDRKLPGGGVESRAEQAKKAAALDRLEETCHTCEGGFRVPLPRGVMLCTDSKDGLLLQLAEALPAWDTFEPEEE